MVIGTYPSILKKLLFLTKLLVAPNFMYTIPQVKEYKYL